MRFVESLLQEKSSSKTVKDFLKHVKHKRRIKLAIFEESDEPKSKCMLVASADNIKDVATMLRTFDRGRSGSSSGNNVPEWAKLALASSNPNSKRKMKYY